LRDALDVGIPDNGHAVWALRGELQNRARPVRNAPHRLPNSD
jgi:hypothetical protein